MFNCHCGHVGKVAVQDLILKYGGDKTVEAVENSARYSRCRGKNIVSTQIIYVSNSELAVYSSHTPKDNKDFKRKSPRFFAWVNSIVLCISVKKYGRSLK